jgi:DNA-binding ferritin-like protein (Dps family)
LWAAFCYDGSVVRAQSDDSSLQEKSAHAQGIRTDRIPPKKYKRWESIKRFVFAEDGTGWPLHPMLQSLWEQLDRSGHTVYIILCDRANNYSNIAGDFQIERFDPLGINHVALIRLYPAVIDNACIGPASARSNGFIPFSGLNKEERYAEVLGHELAHAVHILSDLSRSRMLVEEIEQTNKQFLSQGRQYGYANLTPEILQRIVRRDQILKEFEAAAEEIEMIIWKEIVVSQEMKGRKLMTALTKSKSNPTSMGQPRQ